MGKQYDPALRSTAHGSRLYTAWKRARQKPHVEEWDSFPEFYAWSLQNGYAIGDWLRLLDSSEPYGPENCVWYVPYSNEEDPPPPPTWADEWNKTVNRIRKHYGMPPLPGTSYGD